MPKEAELTEREDQAAFRQPGDLAVYVIPVRDTPNGMDGWTELREAEPIMLGRCLNDGVAGVMVRIDKNRLCHANRPNDVEIIESPVQEPMEVK